MAIAKAIDVSIPTIERVRKRFVCQGLEGALGRQHGGGHSKRLNGEGEAHLLAIALL
ncbi:MAG: helix-turn-helix domain-containing protein [Crocosphaera sp.]